MSRQAGGWTLRARRGWFYVCFTWSGQEHRLPLRTKNRREAQRAAAMAHEEIVSGRRCPVGGGRRQSSDLAALLSAWIESKRTSVDETMVPTLEGYARGFVAAFSTLDRITEVNVEAYTASRLGQVLRRTVLNELSFLRQFLAWCRRNGELATEPRVPPVTPNATGRRSGPQRAKPVGLTPEDAEAILARLPEWSQKVRGRVWPLRARFAFAWETGLRPATISRLSVPDHWRPGATYLEIADEDDKSRFGRAVDLTPQAVAILEAVAPERGLIFGRLFFGPRLKVAAVAVLGELRGRRFAPYDFRHGRAKALLDAGAPIRGVAYLLGHRLITTTDKYLAPERSAGAAALAALAECGGGGGGGPITDHDATVTRSRCK